VIDVARPRLSWINESGIRERGEKQTVYEIRVAAFRRQGMLVDRTGSYHHLGVMGWLKFKKPPGIQHIQYRAGYLQL